MTTCCDIILTEQHHLQHYQPLPPVGLFVGWLLRFVETSLQQQHIRNRMIHSEFSKISTLESKNQQQKSATKIVDDDNPENITKQQKNRTDQATR